MKNQLLISSALLITTLLTFSGCAFTPWTDPLEENESKAVEFLFYDMQKKESTCPNNIEADISFHWDEPIANKSIGGFVNFMDPSSIKFVMTNPLGQPIFALVIHGESFQSINTIYQKYQSGSLRSLLLYYHASPSLRSNNWASYLTGRLGQGPMEVLGIQDDREKRGVWVTIQFIDGKKKKINRLLINPDTRRLLSRVITDEEDTDESAAVISYEEWMIAGNCPFPTKLLISESSFDSEFTVQLSKVTTDQQFNEGDFKIYPPPGYTRQILP